jgi:hypothetical protein
LPEIVTVVVVPFRVAWTRSIVVAVPLAPTLAGAAGRGIGLGAVAGTGFGVGGGSRRAAGTAGGPGGVEGAGAVLPPPAAPFGASSTRIVFRVLFTV